MSTAIVEVLPAALTADARPAETVALPRAAAALRLSTGDGGAALTGAPARLRQAVSARRRRARLDWETVAVILLLLSCLAVGLYWLIWMGL